MVLNIQDDILKLHKLGLLDKLLIDKTTKRRIMWATDAYTSLGSHYGRNEEITPELITGSNAGVLKTRARKEMEQQSSRTRQHGEVSTPLWVCEKMCDYADEMRNGKVRWQKYVDARVLEITCGEAPFLVSRYDVETGEALPVSERIGLLDRKLRTVNENVQTEEEWMNWALRAFWATYGYEFQGDNLLISRVNLLMTFQEYLLDRWKRKPTIAEYNKFINVIVWNVWQMDGLKGNIPYGTGEEEFQEIDWFGMLGGDTEKDAQPRCLVHNWTGGGSVEFLALPTRGKRAMKFDFVIGNPPYQDENVNNGRQPPIYHMFMDAAYKIGSIVELITPARFLFDAGQTPKQWNRKMLQDNHLKVLYYEPDSSKVFRNTDIKGGVSITCRNEQKICGEIGTFTTFDELNSIIQKLSKNRNGDGTLDSVISSRGLYRFTDQFFSDYPGAPQKIGAGTNNMIASNAFERLSEVFLTEVPVSNEEYVKLYGRLGNTRVNRYIKRDYIILNPYLDTYNVLVPKANGTGTFGETLSTPFIAEPGEGTVDTFICIGLLNTLSEAHSVLKYVKTKFLRSLLGAKKVTQDNPKSVWSEIPLQDFTPSSDIDWTKSIPEIDQQLYKKYGLDEAEIHFIESHVKEMT